MTKFKERLDKNNFRHQAVYQARTEPSRNTEHDTTFQLIHTTGSAAEKYTKRNDQVETARPYSVLSLINFEPSDRFERRRYINGLQLTRPVIVFRMAYGGGLGTLNFVWSVDLDDPFEMSRQNTKLIAEISKELPKYTCLY